MDMSDFGHVSGWHVSGCHSSKERCPLQVWVDACCADTHGCQWWELRLCVPKGGQWWKDRSISVKGVDVYSRPCIEGQYHNTRAFGLAYLRADFVLLQPHCSQGILISFLSFISANIWKHYCLWLHCLVPILLNSYSCMDPSKRILTHKSPYRIQGTKINLLSSFSCMGFVNFLARCRHCAFLQCL